MRLGHREIQILLCKELRELSEFKEQLRSSSWIRRDRAGEIGGVGDLEVVLAIAGGFLALGPGIRVSAELAHPSPNAGLETKMGNSCSGYIREGAGRKTDRKFLDFIIIIDISLLNN